MNIAKSVIRRIVVASKVRHVITVLFVLFASSVYAQETPVNNELAVCREQVDKLAAQVVQIRLEYLRKTEEAKAYQAAIDQQAKLKGPAKP